MAASDFLAGQVLTSGHFPPTVSNLQTGSFTFNATTFGIDADTGTYVDCGVAFVAPTTGRVKIDFAGTFDNDTSTAFTIMTPVVRTGSTVGSGTTVFAASDDEAISLGGTEAARFGSHTFVSGLTPGNVYNVRLEHRVSAGIGTLVRRRVTVSPFT